MDDNDTEVSVNSRDSRTIDLVGSLALLGTATAFIAAPIIIRYLTGYLDTWTQNALRYTLASLVWAPYLAAEVRRGRVPRTLWKKALIPALLNVIQQILYTTSFYYIEPAFMSLLVKTSLLWIMVFALLLFPDERGLLRSPFFWAGFPLCVTGVVGVLVLREGFRAEATTIGVILTLGCALSWGAYTVSVRYFLADVGTRTGFSVIAVYTTIELVVLALLFGHPGRSLQMPLTGWLILAGSSMLGIALGHVLYYVAIRKMGATITALFLLITPLGVYAVSSQMFDESLGIKQWIFGLVLLTGAALVLWSQRSLGDAGSE